MIMVGELFILICHVTYQVGVSGPLGHRLEHVVEGLVASGRTEAGGVLAVE